MAIRKRYVGGVRLQERHYEVFVEGVALSKVTKKREKNIVYTVRELADSLLARLKLSYNDIDAYVVSNSMGGLFGIPEFMRYVLPTAFGSHKVVYEVSCDECAGLGAVIRAYKLIKSGIFSRILVVSGMQINLKNIDELKDIIFSDIVSDTENIVKEFLSKEKMDKKEIDQVLYQYYENAMKNNYLDKKELKKKSFDPSEFPELKNSAGVCILSNKYSARVKDVKIGYADEVTVNAQNIYSSISSAVSFFSENIDKQNIDAVEISSINPVLDIIFSKNLGLEKDVKINPSGGSYFSNSPPASPFISFAYLYEYIKSGRRGGLVFSIAIRSLDHFGVVQLINEKKSKKE
ncbi:MAG: hypothetical protein NZ927_01485 [Candidatus Calescibacterium sp.]|nr:hypothetical protein [Candidatus Calescibacterium sp.]MCX7733617.1 hypothetical protein [bacterium]MDW8087198.1 hypothetical protein [Candidatus Calescibacterium sp.]